MEIYVVFIIYTCLQSGSIDLKDIEYHGYILDLVLLENKFDIYSSNYYLR